ncbi:hypothetical protein BS647_07505 [Shigella flexneri 1a]|nr:hypothetical protein BS647_07505 [Shigella flexneri 1a]
MKISVIPEQVAETLDAENHFIVREVFDVHLSDQGFELSTRSVSPYRKDYISDDDSDEDSACYGAFIDQVKWHTEFGHLNRGDMLTSEQHRCSNEKKKF